MLRVFLMKNNLVNYQLKMIESTFNKNNCVMQGNTLYIKND